MIGFVPITADDEGVDQLKKKWQEVATHHDQRLLRLAILRDLYREVHARISQPSATSSDTLALKILQPCLEALRDSRKLPENWDELFRTSTRPPSAPVSEPLSDPVLEAFGRERILRYDRKWEAALATEARLAGWSLWTATLELKLTDVGAANDRLISELWPGGICLFCEPAPPTKNHAEPKHGYWRGRWWIALEPSVTAPQTSDFDRSSFARVALSG